MALSGAAPWKDSFIDFSSLSGVFSDHRNELQEGILQMKDTNMIEGFEPLSVADASETVGGGWIGIVAKFLGEAFAVTELADGTLPDAGPGSGGSGGSTRSGDYGCGGDTNEDPGCGEVGDLGF